MLKEKIKRGQKEKQKDKEREDILAVYVEGKEKRKYNELERKNDKKKKQVSENNVIEVKLHQGMQFSKKHEKT